MYKATVLKSVDLDNSVQSHVSISGGKATHSLVQIAEISHSTLDGLKDLLKSQFGEAYDSYENSMYISIPENEWSEPECPENYVAIITYIEETSVIL